MIKVSVIVPSCNVVNYIRKCLQSITDQSLTDIEILCVDAYSDDGTLQIIDEYARMDKRIRVIHSDRRSYGYQMNLALRQAAGEYIGIVESDDFISDKMYEDLYAYAKRLNCDVLKAPFIEYHDDKNQEPYYYMDLLNDRLPSDICFSAKEHGEILCYHPSIWSGIYKREYLINNGIHFVEVPGAAYVDVVFRVDSLIHSDIIAWYSKPSYFYRMSNPSSSSSRYDILAMAERWKEIHERMELVNEDYDRYYASYMISDEYDGTLWHMNKMNISRSVFEMIRSNLDHVPIDSIERSDVLKQVAYRDLLCFKKDPELYYKHSQQVYKYNQLLYSFSNLLLPRGTRRRMLLKKAILKMRKN